MYVLKEEEINIFDEMCIKVLKIYENIVINKKDLTKISENSITLNMEEKKSTTLMNFCKSAINNLNAKSQKTLKLKKETIDFKEAIEIILKSIKEKGNIAFYNIYKLNCLYFLFRYINSITDLEGNEISIADNIEECICDVNSYYGILSLLGEIEPDKDSKKIKIKNYYNKIKYLDPILFKNRINSFFLFKSIEHEQYKINLPKIENCNLEDFNALAKNMNYIHTALKILRESEDFQIQERFYYFKKYQNKDDIFLEIINKILEIKKKPLLDTLKDNSLDIIEEEIQYYKTLLSKKSEEYDELLKNINENEKEMENMNTENESIKLENKKLKEKIDILNDKNKSMADKLTKIKEEIENKVNDNKSLLSQISSLENELEKEKNKIKGIQCRDVNSKIIEYFYFSVPEIERINKEKEKEKDKKVISGKEKIELIINNMKSNFPYYYKYISNNNVNLNNILLSLIKHNLKFNYNEHKNLNKDIFLKANSEIISNSLEFLFNCSQLFNQYIFMENEEDEETEISNKNTKSILPNDIFNDFKDLNEKYSKIVNDN